MPGPDHPLRPYFLPPLARPSVERFNPRQNTMERDAVGEWVRYSDYATLLARYEEVVEKLRLQRSEG